MNLQFDTKVEENYISCLVTGEIDLYNARQLKDKVSDLMDDSAEDADLPRNLVLDIKNVSYIDSTGLGILIGIKRRITENGGNLMLVLSQERILQLFTITGLTNIFTITETMEDAVAKL